MRKTIIALGLVAAAALFIFSCSKEQPELESNEATIKTQASRQGRELTFAEWLPANENRLHEVTRGEIIALENRETRKDIYGVLPAERKAHVWKEKYFELLGSNSYSQEQKNFINLLMPYLTTEFFSLDEVPPQIHNEIQQLREQGNHCFPGSCCA